MGIYLNSVSPYTLYKSEVCSPYFVDKSQMLRELIPLAEVGNRHVCVTRPRRFGKTVMANMIGAFFGKDVASKDVFETLKISEFADYRKHLNQYNTIYIDFSVVDIDFRENGSVREDLQRIFAEKKERFVFVFDEWDSVFHMPFVTEDDKKSYLLFLKGLLKDKPYVALAYMTGILPIAKYSSGSELNMFMEYTMASESKFGNVFGFSDKEVDMLYERYCENNAGKEETLNGERMYNPRSVVAALENNNLGSYWTSSGPYDEIFYYVENNIADVRKDIALMISGEGVKAKIQEYAATSLNLLTREEILSAMVVYGFLSYYNGKVYIPNKELMDKFDEMVQKEASLGYVYRLAKESERMLEATLHGDTETMENILAYVHNTETPILSYNNETELSVVVNLVYLAARDRYRVEREDKSGKGFVDFIFYPEDRSDTCIILELKVDHTPEEAIEQIRDKDYMLRFMGKLGELPKYTGEILGVGISYSKIDKIHRCKTEILRNRI